MIGGLLCIHDASMQDQENAVEGRWYFMQILGNIPSMMQIDNKSLPCFGISVSAQHMNVTAVCNTKFNLKGCHSTKDSAQMQIAAFVKNIIIIINTVN